MTTRPVGLSRDLAENRVMRAELPEADLVVWRNSKGALAAWDNRCPHRGMRLSHGFVRGDKLACLYHGWHYGASGRCSYIPAHPDLDPPETIRATAHKVTEAEGVIWVSLDDKIDPPALPKGLEPLRSFVIEADEAAIRAANDAELNLLLSPVSGTSTLAIALVPTGAALPIRRALSRRCDALRRAIELGHVAA